MRCVGARQDADVGVADPTLAFRMYAVKSINIPEGPRNGTDSAVPTDFTGNSPPAPVLSIGTRVAFQPRRRVVRGYVVGAHRRVRVRTVCLEVEGHPSVRDDRTADDGLVSTDRGDVRMPGVVQDSGHVTAVHAQAGRC